MSGHNQEVWISAQFPDGYTGWAIDCGANDGAYESNTLALEVFGWTVLCIEADNRYGYSLSSIRKHVALCAVGARAREWATFHASTTQTPSGQSLNSPHGKQPLDLQVPVLTLNQILHIWNFPKLDVLTMDIEGGELDALAGLDLDRWRPKVIVAELFGSWPDCQPYLEEHGYNYVQTLGFDKCYVRRDE